MNQFTSKKKIFWLILGITILFLLGIFQGLFKKNIQNYIDEDGSKRNSLEETYKKIMELDRSNDPAGIYEYLLPSEKSKISLEEFIRKAPSKKPLSVEFTIHSIEIRGDRGLVERTRIACYSSECTGKDRSESKLKKEYFYVNGKWYQPLDNDVFCDRAEEYFYPEEFKRALSLILQRQSQSSLVESAEVSKDYKKIKNCLDIQYASSDKELEGAEGLFAFNEKSTSEQLQIFISPKYKIKDDLLTSILLSHELHHAYLHATGQDQYYTCFENEAEAFAFEVGFFEFDLNKEEQDSIIKRYSTSQEVTDFLNTRESILKNIKSNSGSLYEGALPFVKSNPFYQEQCVK